MKIRVDGSVRSMALARLLEEAALPEREHLFLVDIREDWARVTGLRQSDLDMTLRDAIRQQGVEMEWRADEVLVQFPDDAGETGGRRESPQRGLLEALRARLVLWYTRRRGRRSASAGGHGGRRLIDRVSGH